MDRHADTRDAKRHKARLGMAVRGRSVVTLQSQIVKRSAVASAKRKKGGR